MGQNKLPLYAFVDETGNTGHNLFDPVQPDFYTAALITKGDFDLSSARSTKAIAAKLGKEALHAKELGIWKLEVCAYEVLDVLIKARAYFFVSRVQKSRRLRGPLVGCDTVRAFAQGWWYGQLTCFRPENLRKGAGLDFLDR